MHINATDLAKAIADVYQNTPGGRPMPTITRAQLAVALGVGSGFALDGRHVYAVLRSPLDADEPGSLVFKPTLVMGTQPMTQPGRKPRTTAQVAAFFRSKCSRIGKSPTGSGPCIPDGAHTRRSLTIAGPQIGRDINPVETTEDGTTIKWYPLKDVVVGGFVYLVGNNEVALFQRTDTDAWIIQWFEGTDIVNLPDVLARHGVTAITPTVGGPITLIRQPASQ